MHGSVTGGYTAAMWTFLKHQLRILAFGFIIGSVIALFLLVDIQDWLITLAAGAGGGILLVTVIRLLERRFPEPSDSGD